jgi:TPP-dependent 2-oxoacid decarboxylase
MHHLSHTLPALYTLFHLPHTLYSNIMDKQVSVGEFLLRRISELGITDIFGVPGDYNLGILDLIEDDESIRWIGGTNELNAAYSADGYARIRGIGALITTFGVGELSAINGGMPPS